MDSKEALRKTRAIIDHVVHGESGIEALYEAHDLLSSALSQQPVAAAVDRERSLASARFRAACYGLVSLVEGPASLRWQDGQGFRLKDSEEWAKFYVAVKAMQERGEPDALAAAPQTGPTP